MSLFFLHFLNVFIFICIHLYLFVSICINLINFYLFLQFFTLLSCPFTKLNVCFHDKRNYNKVYSEPRWTRSNVHVSVCKLRPTAGWWRWSFCRVSVYFRTLGCIIKPVCLSGSLSTVDVEMAQWWMTLNCLASSSTKIYIRCGGISELVESKVTWLYPPGMERILSKKSHSTCIKTNVCKTPTLKSI